MIINTLLIFGFGYSAQYVADLFIRHNWQVIGTTRDETKRQQQHENLELIDFNLEAITAVMDRCTHILVCTPPNESDPVLSLCDELFTEHSSHLQWLGYLSTTGVYGDHQGRWVDENTPTKATSPRTERRIKAEQDWLTFGAKNSITTAVFRLAGIYGPGRNVLVQLKNSTARCIVKEGQFFSRIHVADIASTIWAAVQQPIDADIYNVCDDQPAPSHEVLQYGAQLLGVAMPKCIAYEQADLSPMAREFYSNNRRVKNDKIKNVLKVDLQYPTYQAGLSGLLKTL